MMDRSGADPLVRSQPPGWLSSTGQADGGVGRGPGGPPHRKSKS
jgi:hypothetical protein